ncbi:hypothetical protein DES53_10285 [Roseimicrobium gellanilyticum]|uniref:Uncharacterized protein n=1 Tax=Roseimicrobium gellanilyticum TaxID=748857 RepID=A0A366HS32_9BACT|nr:hypothetical protein [Roseimicrobium gellanilyticum]RBP45703.1 hypothetical protein DES53_10285 [Roseimicrobium gellanilyticum]
MNEGSKTRKKSRWLVVAAIVISIVTLLGIFGYRIYRVAALQGALAKRWQVAFAGGEPPSPGPAWANKAVASLIQYRGGTNVENIVWRERLLALSRSETDAIFITTSDSFHKDFSRHCNASPSSARLLFATSYRGP